ncbi:hypothetical protein JKF63_01376 [Porcisia hertigi]|uniref:Cullin family profile domain-containing protein n=1 Tax=Porcisia hertigi TaxID=2761500 RepID=A0A836HGE1_9TRYP|nr:hypothetical protein JKF63_01376 [Porcisia hertigi]
MSCASASATFARSATLSGSTLSRHSMDVEGALVILAEVLDALDTRGLAIFLESGAGVALPPLLQTTWPSALAVLATSAPLNTMVAETLLGRVNVAFSVEIDVYRSAIQCCSGALSAEVALASLERLGEVYCRVHSYLWGWCSALRTPDVAGFFAVRLRCALLQADLVTGEEPPGKQALFSFLRRHGRSILARQQRAANDDRDEEDTGCLDRDGVSGTGAGTPGTTLPSSSTLPAPDPVMASLHRLTLSESAEVKQLWRSVLESGIRERLENLSDDFTARFLHKELSWLEHSVVPFVRTVLPDSDVESDLCCCKSGSCRGGASVSHHRRGVERTSGKRDTMTGCGEGDSTNSFSHVREAVRAEREAWCVDLRQLLLHTYARKRFDNFWEILSDYPDSVPALGDMHYCLQSTPESGLKTELVQIARHLLSSRLHRAGTRTEDILAILINAIHAFCILFPRNEQSGVVFSVTSDTLEHLRRRKDWVPAVVQALMQPGGAMKAVSSLATQAVPKDLAGGLGFFDSGACGKEGELHQGAARDRPDVVRVLLSSIPRRALVEEYQQMLAEQLLQKPMHEFDTTPEEEVLERLRQVLGETVLDRCAVMVRDMQMSRRISQQLCDHLALGSANRPPQPRTTTTDTTCTSNASVSVLSMSAWPPLARCSSSNGSDAGLAAVPLKYCPHPALQKVMDSLAGAYKQLKDNQRLSWLLSLGRVELELKKKDPSKENAFVWVPQVLSLFDASIVLHVKCMSVRGGISTPVPLKEVARVMEVKVEELRGHAQRLSPSVLVFQPATDLVIMQLSLAASADFVFVEDRANVEEAAKPTGLLPERVKLMERMAMSLLKTRGAQSSTAIHNSLKLLAKFEGSSADVVELLRSLVDRGLIVFSDAKQYALPSK